MWMPAGPTLGLNTFTSIFRREYVRSLVMMVYNVRKGSGTFVDMGDPVVWILFIVLGGRLIQEIGDQIIIIITIIITDSNTDITTTTSGATAANQALYVWKAWLLIWTSV